MVVGSPRTAGRQSNLRRCNRQTFCGARAALWRRRIAEDRGPNGRSGAHGYMRLARDHTRFKMICALRRTTMSAQIQAIIAEQPAQGDRLLSENFYVAVTPEMK